MPFSRENWTRHTLSAPNVDSVCAHQVGAHVQLPSLAPGFPRCARPQSAKWRNGHHVGEHGGTLGLKVVQLGPRSSNPQKSA
eukprot:scaffold95178_cov60-Phaeocystis_antarctica.AAC.1